LEKNTKIWEDNKMIKKIILVLALSLSMIFMGQGLFAGQGHKNKTLFQASPVAEFAQSQWDGWMEMSELKANGDFGVGTFDGVDGEMVMLDNVIYKAKGDGSVVRADPGEKSPLAMVTKFRADFTETLTQDYTLSQLKSYIESLLPSPNIMYAIRISGQLRNIHTRSFDKVPTPYCTVTELFTSYQRQFYYDEMFGALVGIWGPAYFAGASQDTLEDLLYVTNLPGFHFHVISDDRQAGGHLLDTEVLSGAALEISYIHTWEVVSSDRETL
jgi:acetolactate decarboxylase